MNESQGGGPILSNGGMSNRSSRQKLIPLPNLKSNGSKINVLGSSSIDSHPPKATKILVDEQQSVMV